MDESREWFPGQAWPFICLKICVTRCSSPHGSLKLESNISSPWCWLEKMKSSGKALGAGLLVVLAALVVFVVSHLTGSVDHCTDPAGTRGKCLSASPVFLVFLHWQSTQTVCGTSLLPSSGGICPQEQPEPCILSKQSGFVVVGEAGEEVFWGREHWLLPLWK